MSGIIFWAIVMAVVYLVWFEIRNLGSNFKFNLILLFIAGVLLTVGYVWFKTGVNILSKDGILGLGKAYYSWLAGLANNFGSITGYAVQQDWGTSNITAPASS